ncbi:MAG: RNA polymerase subunit sigma-24 [Ignavibacteria bacterium RIFOXYB2_FULL_35_12]|nr:MAG: RNA polymerase subunit sigma-24 [Ignavibacteria bacterium GWA2_36_19]OGU50373.1 MAG: RNA polymerase subunit sigma-24 [Ignavibacteria bacterium GWC2_35_8]OGU58857.1 MAG: RNA polymerase subunit sigma-24 [Ignavibacteria bacterium GWF2_35_20]OGU86027.1 MAG: RNA polymerase subunit sigma-24 [Ignavibacteria bacterium RIFOXYA12_FULL_35_25]OGU91015.1 MAG: RNA polymerase subunit sigma-24 [Ignavibacteria bacterium RIFOXYC12_FULL_35_11]OGU97151.1 MAG: RNA polymerase subunit sigma-24 [Ignavibacteri
MLDKNLVELSDEELIAEFQLNNTINAFEILVQRYKNPLTNFVYRFLGDYEACSDVVQETMIKFYRNKDSYKSIAKFSTWIYTIAGNLARTEYQRRRRRQIFSINSYGEENENYEIPDESYRPDIMTDSVIKDKIIQKSLLKVSRVYREAVILRDIQELSYEEIAEIMGLTVGTVKSRINRGRAQLQKLLKNIYNE